MKIAAKITERNYVMKRLHYLTAVLLAIILLLPGTPAIGGDKPTAQHEKELQELLRKEKEGPQMLAMIQWFLWRTGYFDPPPVTGKIDADTKKALRGYQKHRGLPITGTFDVRTFDQFHKDVELIDPDPVSVSGFSFFSDMWDTYFSANGTWEFYNSKEEMGDPIQVTELKCYRDMEICFEATASIGQEQLHVLTEISEVERWDEYEIVTKPADYQCVRYVLRVNRQHRSVKKIRTTLSTKEICKGMDSGDKYIKLVNGFDIWWEFKGELNKERGDVFSPTIKKGLEKFLK